MVTFLVIMFLDHVIHVSSLCQLLCFQTVLFLFLDCVYIYFQTVLLLCLQTVLLFMFLLDCVYRCFQTVLLLCFQTMFIMFLNCVYYVSRRCRYVSRLCLLCFQTLLLLCFQILDWVVYYVSRLCLFMFLDCVYYVSRLCLFMFLDCVYLCFQTVLKELLSQYRFTLEPDQDLEHKWLPVSRPKGNVLVKFEQINPNKETS